ncbi:uncharacterized protein LOC128299546 [Anopheles moucheti]|uniref:uncharacterized protein LOC128299546 n=1 Tax=Anopheles moucheti TaxID=186751 RepID=UPI0022F0579E|nr:uncharacterized protein LOC128299546 [Anopheles moucheti]
MNEFRSGYLVVLLALVSFGCQFVVAQTDEYEYYYEEVNATSTQLPLTATSIETTTVTLVVAMQGTLETTTPPALVVENSEEPTNITALPIVDDTTVGILVHNNWTTTAVDSKPMDTSYAHRTDQILTQLNSTRPTKYNVTKFKTTTRPNTQPGIVLNIYTGMYGMHSREKNRPSGGKNNFWPRAQSTLQGWYGMYNRRPVQSYIPRPKAPPVYRGRGPQNGYDGGYNSFTHHTATKPRRNNQQTRGTALDQQASLAVFNFLLQALGQRGGSSGRSQGSQSQVQQGTRRRH